ncbi:MAG: ArsA family ATPase [Acidimicrobiales bacterium]
MDVATFCAESRVLVVAGKGGVGKTTVAAALARMAADAGCSVLVVELEGKAGISAAFGASEPLGYDEVDLYHRGGPGERGSVRGRRITPDDALLEYLADHGLQRVSKRLVSSGVVDVVATAIPGIRDVLVLGKVKQLERDRAADLIVVDAPATGHAVTFLTSAGGLLDAARGGPVRAQAADVVELLADPSRCRVLLVTLAEEMPVSETVEAAYQLEDRAGVQLGPVIVNAWDDAPALLSSSTSDAASAAGVVLNDHLAQALETARRFRLRRCELAGDQVARLARELPLPQLRLPQIHSEAIGPDQLELLGGALAAAVGGLAVRSGAS